MSEREPFAGSHRVVPRGDGPMWQVDHPEEQEPDRDAEVARIAATLDTIPVSDYPWHFEAPHHPEFAAALYDAGLRTDTSREVGE